jgi:outer membrane protein
VARVPLPPELSLGQALLIARSYNPVWLASRNDRSGADWSVRAAWGGLLPTASANAGVSWQGSGEQLLGSFTQDQLGVGSQPSYYFSRYGLNLSYQLDGASLFAPWQADAGRDASLALIDAASVDLEAAVTKAYLSVLRNQEEVTLAEQQLERATFDLRMATGLEEVGRGTALDVMQAELQVGRAEVALLQTRNALEAERFRLLTQMGVDVSLDAEVRELTTSFELTEPPWVAEELYDIALERNPTLRARRSSAEESRAGIEIARSAYFPTLSLQAGWSGFTRQAGDTGFLLSQAQGSLAAQAADCQFSNEIFNRLADPLPPLDCGRYMLTDEVRNRIVQGNRSFPFDFTGQPPSASLTVSVPLFPGLSRERQMEAARLQRDDAEQQVRGQELALRANIFGGVSRVRTAYQSALLEERNQTYADEQLRLAQERYRLGAITFVELVEAGTIKGQADRQRLAAVYTYHDTITDLEATVGAPLRDP